MRRVPQDVHREVLERTDSEFGTSEPSWYAVWLGPPRGEKSELLGRTERMLRPRWWRAYPVTGEYPKELRGWTEVAKWLLDVRATHSLVPDEVGPTLSDGIRGDQRAGYSADP